MYLVHLVWGLQYITAKVGQKLGRGVGGTGQLFSYVLLVQ